jgi:SAM-dependent methyltransferase
MPRDIFEPPPPRATPPVSRRAFLGLARARAEIDYDGATAQVRAEDHEPLARELAPVETVLDELAGGDALRLPATAWHELDLHELPYPDASFDAVVSAFGAALAPRPRRMARELVRVVRPGGVVAIAAWVPKGLPGRLDELLERPEGVRPPSDWGRQEVMRERLAPLLEELELRTRTVQLRFADAEAFFDALSAPAHVRPALDRLLASCNNSIAGVEIDARYLIGLGRRPL